MPADPSRHTTPQEIVAAIRSAARATTSELDSGPWSRLPRWQQRIALRHARLAVIAFLRSPGVDGHLAGAQAVAAQLEANLS